LTLSVVTRRDFERADSFQFVVEYVAILYHELHAFKLREAGVWVLTVAQVNSRNARILLIMAGHQCWLLNINTA